MRNEWKNIPLGFDLVQFKPDFSQSLEENWKRYREAFFKVYGHYPPDPQPEHVKEPET